MSSVKLIAIVMASVFMLLVAMAFSTAELYMMSTALMSLPLISYALGRYAARGVDCHRR